MAQFERSQGLQKWQWILAISIFTIVVYLPAIQGGFIWDDDVFLYNNSLILASDGLYHFWFTTQAPDYFPMTSSMLWMEWRLFGMNASGYHFINVLLHIVSSITIALVLKRLKIPGAWVAAFIFAIHPVNVESVAWITERKNVLPMVFYSMSILFFQKYLQEEKRTYYGFSLVLHLFALLSKTAIVMQPVILLLIMWWSKQKIKIKDLIKTIPFFLLSGGLGLLTIWFQYNRAIKADIVRTDGFLSRFFIAGKAIWFYLYKALLPFNLSFIYPRWTTGQVSIIDAIPILLIIVIFGIFFYYRKSWGHGFLFGMGYFIISLFPVLGFFNIYFMKYSLVADHWQYVAIIGPIALCTALGLRLLTSYFNTITKFNYITTGCILTILGILTFHQSKIYANAEILFRDIIQKNPHTSMAYNNLGRLLNLKGNINQAIEHYERALMLKPDNEKALNNLGKAWYDKKNYQKAITYYKKALALKPDYPMANNNMGSALFQLGQLEMAEKYFQKALELNPRLLEALNNFGAIKFKLGQTDKAIEQYQKLLAINPKIASAHFNLGNIYYSKKDYLSAIDHYSIALQINPGYINARRGIKAATTKWKQMKKSDAK